MKNIGAASRFFKYRRKAAHHNYSIFIFSFQVIFSSSFFSRFIIRFSSRDM